MPSLNSCTATKPAPKAGDIKTIYINGFDFKRLEKKDGTPVLKNGNQVTLLLGFFVDEDGREYNVTFGSTDGIQLDTLNNLLEALNKPIVDEVSVTSVNLPDVGKVPGDWASPINGHWGVDKKDAKYSRLESFSRQ